MLDNHKCWCDCKKCHVSEKDYIWNPYTWSCDNGKYLASIMDDSAIMYDKVLESYNKETKTIPSFNEKKAICKTQNFHILLAFLSNTITWLIAVSIYCYLIKYREKTFNAGSRYKKRIKWSFILMNVLQKLKIMAT